MIDENYYIFVEDENNKFIDKFVIRIVKKIDWIIESVTDNVPYDLEMMRYDKEYIIDDIIDDVRNQYDYVQEINFSEINDYML